MISLYFGGARSGKSCLAEKHAEEWLRTNPEGARTYIATAQVFDDEMADRVAKHRIDRGENWTTVEEPLDLCAALSAADGSNYLILVDCLTLWLTNVLLAEKDCEAAVLDLCTLLPSLSAEVVLVSNEVGMGIVPENKLARQFRDIQGRANQDVAAVADHVTFVAAGLPLVLKNPK